MIEWPRLWPLLMEYRIHRTKMTQIHFSLSLVPESWNQTTSILWLSPIIARKVFPLYVDNKHSFRYFLCYIFLETFSSDCSPSKNILWASTNFVHYSVVLTMMWKNILSGIFITISVIKYMEPVVLSIEKCVQNERF